MPPPPIILNRSLMRHLIALLAIHAALAQTTVYDSDGRPQTLPSFEESRTRKLLEDGPNGRIYEESVARRDASGKPLPAEKLRVVERKTLDGASVIETTTFRTDLNGKFSPTEHSVQTTLQQGPLTTISSTIEKPNISGGFVPVEKIASRTTASSGGREVTSRSVYVPDANGRFVEAVRESRERAPDGKNIREVSSEYRNAISGQMELSGQKVTVEMRNPDGSSTSEITIYGLTAPGRPADGQLKLREQQMVTVKPGSNGTTVESFSVRRPNLSDQKLGAFEKVSVKVIQPTKTL